MVPSLLTFLLIVHSVSSSSILFYFGTSPQSHRLSAWPLATELARAGHAVTILSAFSSAPLQNSVQENSTIKEISIEEIVSPLRTSFFKGPWELRFTDSHQILWDLAAVESVLACEMILSDKDIQQWLQSKRYDLVILDSLNNECGLGFVSIFEAKLIIYSAGPMFMSISDTFGFPAETNWIPDIQRHYSHDMSFLQRLANTIRTIRWHLFKEVYLFQELEKIFKKFTKGLKQISSMKEVEANASLVLVNSHFSEEYARSLPPFLVSVGGVHITEDTRKLPKDIIDFIDDKPFFYVSFGTALKMSEMPKETLDILLRALISSGHRFIIKCDSKLDILKTNSIFVSKWLPQQDILAHSKIQGFITTGSTLSMQEAIYYSVPMIVLPVIFEQDYNAERIERLGIGIVLHITDLINEDQLHNSLENLQGNKSIHGNVKKISQSFKDRPMKPLESALWWIAYVLRTEETRLLKSSAIHQTWLQRRNLDIWFLLFIIAISTICSIFFMFYFAISSLVKTFCEHFHYNNVPGDNNKAKLL